MRLEEEETRTTTRERKYPFQFGQRPSKFLFRKLIDNSINKAGNMAQSVVQAEEVQNASSSFPTKILSATTKQTIENTAAPAAVETTKPNIRRQIDKEGGNTTAKVVTIQREVNCLWLEHQFSILITCLCITMTKRTSHSSHSIMSSMALEQIQPSRISLLKDLRSKSLLRQQDQR